MSQYKRYFTRAILAHYPDWAARLVEETDEHFTIITPDI